jgi:molecular chaperone HtpG
VKYGIISEEKFYEKAKDFALLKNTEGSFFTFEEYKEKAKALQEDKDKNLIYLYTTDAARQDTYVQAAKAKGYDVLLMDTLIDSHFINFLEQRLENTQLRRVDADTVDKLIDKDEKMDSVLSAEEETQVKELFEKAIVPAKHAVSVQSMAPEELPVVITLSEFMRRMREMARTGGGMGFMGDMPEQLSVAVNANHPLIQKMLKASTEEDQVQLAKQAYDLALLSQGMLTGADLTQFIKRSVRLAAE